ncbi:hypothetical protein LX36DRAFT_662734 [Colletotrichum falcatum]|nr:hypothetical protein LX36DRAFT_662734 [Colletotrichum falcatum]
MTMSAARQPAAPSLRRRRAKAAPMRTRPAFAYWQPPRSFFFPFPADPLSPGSSGAATLPSSDNGDFAGKAGVAR